MKKCLSILLALILVLTLTACRGKNHDGSAGEQYDKPVADNGKPEETVENTDVMSEHEDKNAPSDNTEDGIGEPASEDDSRTDDQQNDPDQPADPGDDPVGDASGEDVDSEFTGLETKDEEVIEIGEGQGVGGF